MTSFGFTAHLAPGEVLHLWQKPLVKGAGSRVSVGDAVLQGPPSDDYQMQSHIAAGGETHVKWGEDTAVSVAYAFDPAHPEIRLLHAAAKTQPNDHRFRLHLSPPFGWMNDPNGLIERQGQTHLFYQHYPHAHRWDTMHWGHAVSPNLVDWSHRPVFLHPRAEMLADDAKKGGAFSGTAIATPKGLRVFHTDREDGRLPEQEWQMTATSTDLLTASPSTPVIDTRPALPGFGRDLRDPFVFKGPDGLWKMLLGGADETSALVLLYQTADPDAATGWHYAGILHREPLDRAVPAECPCLIALDGQGEGLWALVFGLVGHQTPVRGKLNPSVAAVGRFDGQVFTELARRELDFIGDCYAFQSFRWQDRPVGIAWAANWAYVLRTHDFPSCMTFARRLVWQDGALLLPLVETVQTLRQTQLTTSVDALRHGIPLPDGLAELTVDFAGADSFSLTLDHPNNPLQLTFENGVLELTGKWARPGVRGLRHMVETASPTSLTLHVDVGLIELSVDGGRLSGTKRIDTDLPFTTLSLTAADGGVANASLWQLRAAAQNQKESSHGHR